MNLNFRLNILKIIGLSTLFGFFSGILGGLIIASIYAPVYGLKDEIVRSPLIRGGALKETEKLARMNAALVTFYVNRHGGIPVAEDRVGYGTLLTTDGWVVTSAKVLRLGSSKLIAVLGDRSVRPVERIVPDTGTNAVFLHIKGERLGTLGAGAAGDLLSDAMVGTGDAANHFYKFKFLGLSYTDGDEDELKSSEKLTKFAFVATPEPGGLAPGGPVINNNGELIGVFDDPASGKVIPFEYLALAFRELLRSGHTSHGYLGVYYRDLSAILYINKRSDRGAEIVSPSGGRGVLRGSPAASAGLVDGDIILRVGDEELSSKLSLSEALASYENGAVINLLVLSKDGKEERKEIILGEKF